MKGELAVRKRLQTLDELQQIDLRLDGIAGERAALLEEIDLLDQKLVDARQDCLLKEEEQTAVEGAKLTIEETLATETDNIVRSEARLKEIKTQKEYLAVSKEITMARKLKIELEEQLLQKIAQVDELNGTISEYQSNLQQLEENVALKKAEVQGKIDALDQGSEADRLSREEKGRSLPPAVFKRYGTLREMRRGIAVVEARDGSCLGCNMNLPPQLYNTLFRGEELITCPHCQRMLVLRQPPQG